MDSEAAVIRSEMSRTRADLDRKLALLEERARALVPQLPRPAKLPEFFLDRAIGSVLTVIGLKMAVGHVRRTRRRRVRTVGTSMAVM